MSKKEVAELLNRWFRNDPAYDKDEPWYVKESNIDNFLTRVTVDNKTYDVYIGGNDEMFDVDEFYQLGVTKDGKIYQFFFEIPEDEDGNETQDLGSVDYTKAYRAIDITGHEDDYACD